MDGVALIKKLKQINKKVPVIFITAFPELENAVEAIRNGVVDYIIKPFDMDVVAAKVDSAIRKMSETSEEHYNRLYREQKNRFLNRFSRELRTPLSPVAGYITLLLKKEFGDIPPRQLAVLRDIAKNSEKLKMLTDDLMLLYAIENTEEPFSIKPHPLSEVIEGAVASGRESIKRKRQNLSVKIFDGIEEISCDIKKISRALWHLIDNAVKFSYDRADIELSIRKYRYDGKDFVKFSVWDSGKMIEGVNGRELFRQFYNVNKYGDDFEKSNDAKGLGIGLTLTRAIIEAHHGRVWIEESDPSKRGNIFSFIIPIV
jgi:signal transduction histidine kinase